MDAVSDVFCVIADLLFDAQMLVKAHIDQSVITTPAVADDNAFQINLAADNAL